jgi:soluble lytic murein transglycosylase-like protein
MPDRFFRKDERNKNMRMKFAFLLASAITVMALGANNAEARNRHHVRHRAHIPAVSQATRNRVVALIQSQAPRYGVPTWFALKIARVESGYNPNVTGAAGEIGVFQMKCATARGVGFSGSCRALYNPATNVQYGLKHLSLAVRSSHGNLRLAASKHNGGLGTKRIVRSYVAMIF